MRTVQLYGAGAATANAVAQVTIPSAGKIRGVQYSVDYDLDADADYVVLELSKSPSSQIAVNGAQDPFFEVRNFANLTAAGNATSGQVGFAPLNVDVRQGEIVYLHALSSNGSYKSNFILHYE